MRNVNPYFTAGAATKDGAILLKGLGLDEARAFTNRLTLLMSHHDVQGFRYVCVEFEVAAGPTDGEFRGQPKVVESSARTLRFLSFDDARPLLDLHWTGANILQHMRNVPQIPSSLQYNVDVPVVSAVVVIDRANIHAPYGHFIGSVKGSNEELTIRVGDDRAVENINVVLADPSKCAVVHSYYSSLGQDPAVLRIDPTIKGTAGFERFGACACQVMSVPRVSAHVDVDRYISERNEVGSEFYRLAYNVWNQPREIARASSAMVVPLLPGSSSTATVNSSSNTSSSAAVLTVKRKQPDEVGTEQPAAKFAKTDEGARK